MKSAIDQEGATKAAALCAARRCAAQRCLWDIMCWEKADYRQDCILSQDRPWTQSRMLRCV